MIEPVKGPGRWVRLPLRTWLVISHVIVLVLPVLGLLASGAWAWDLVNQTRSDVLHQAELVAMLAAADVERARVRRPMAGLAEVAPRLGSRLVEVKTRTLAGFQITGPDGRVVASSGATADVDLSGDPEVQRALVGARGFTTRPRERVGGVPWNSDTSRRAALRVFVAVPIDLAGERLGAVVASRTPREEVQAMAQMAPRAWGAALVVVVLTIGVAVLAGWGFSRSLRKMAAASRRVAEGSAAATDLLARPEGSRVAEVAELAAAVRHMACRLQDQVDYISEFAGNVSHEFKTPLTTLRGTIELLADDGDMEPEQRRRFLDNAAGEVARLQNLVEGLLDLARAEETEGFELLDLDELVAQVAERWPGTRVSPGAAAVRGNARQVEAAVGNLIENAWRYGGDQVSVRVAGFAEGARTGLRVADDGPGIRPANLPHVFERFFTTDRRTGTGLGLALVAAVARAHRGGVSVRSAPGDTVFEIWLPVAS